MDFLVTSENLFTSHRETNQEALGSPAYATWSYHALWQKGTNKPAEVELLLALPFLELDKDAISKTYNKRDYK